MSESDITKRTKSSNKSAGRRHVFGAHLSIAGGVHHALLAAQALRCDCVQVFVKNQQQWAAAPLKPEVLTAWHKLRQAAPDMPVVAHATYLVNLASARKSLWEQSRRAFAEELRCCDALEIPYLVVHPGAAGEAPVSAAIGRVAAALNRIFAESPDLRCMPLLETTAGQGTTLGRTFEELGAIIAQVEEPRRVGVCVDTCHVFAAGYDIRSPHGYARMMKAAAAAVGLRQIRCWHLNDSRGELGRRLDRHAHIGLGQIGMAGFRNLLRDEAMCGLPMILETPKGQDERGREWDTVNLQRLRRCAAAVRGRGR